MDDDDVIGGPPMKIRWQDTRQPVTVTWLAGAFRQSTETVQKKLRDCPELADGKYDFLEAAGFLVTPRFSREFYIRSLRKGDLPPSLLESIWAARLKEQNWRERAGELWRTEDVVSVFGDIFKRMKTTLQLFADTVEQEHALTDGQRAKIIEMADALMLDMHGQFQELAKERMTPTQESEHPEE